MVNEVAAATPPQPEPQRNPEFLTMDRPLALQARLLMGNKAPENKNALDPGVTNLPATTDQAAMNTMYHESRDNTLDLMAKASTKAAVDHYKTVARENPQLATNAAQIADWKQKMVRLASGQNNQVHMQKLRDKRIGGINFAQFDDNAAQALYDKYIAANTRQGADRKMMTDTDGKKYIVEDVKLFFFDIREAYRVNGRVDQAALAADLETYKWLAKIFPPEDQKNLADMLQAEINLNTQWDTFQREAFAPGAQNQNILRVNTLSDEERTRLERLNGASQIQTEVAPAYVARANPATPPTPANPAPNPELRNGNGERDRRRALSERFGEINGEPLARGNNGDRYRVGFVPDTLQIEPGEMARYETTEPFFTNVVDGGTTIAANANRAVVPYVFEIGDGNPDTTARSARFIDAENRTDKDSGLFAIAAAAASRPQYQERLYKLLGTKIIEMHRNNPQLLRRWLQAQGDQNDVNQSVQMFIINDMQRGQQDSNTNGSLLAYSDQDVDNKGRPLIDRNAFNDLWNQRMNTLNGQLNSPTTEMSDNEIRWLEFLSHSIKIPDLLTAINTQAAANRPPRPGGGGGQGGNRGGGNRGNQGNRPQRP